MIAAFCVSKDSAISNDGAGFDDVHQFGGGCAVSFQDES